MIWSENFNSFKNLDILNTMKVKVHQGGDSILNINFLINLTWFYSKHESFIVCFGSIISISRKTSWTKGSSLLESLLPSVTNVVLVSFPFQILDRDWFLFFIFWKGTLVSYGHKIWKRGYIVILMHMVPNDLKLLGDSGKVLIFEWSGWQFDSHREIFSLLDR